MVNALLLLGVLATSRPQAPEPAPAPEPERLKVACLTDVVSEVFPDKSYRITYVPNLEFAPVVYDFRNPVGTKKDLLNFCNALFLKCEIDEEEHQIKISKGPKLTEDKRIALVNQQVALINQITRPYLNTSVKEIDSAIDTLLAIYRQEKVQEEKQKLGFRFGSMALLTDPASRALLLSLISNHPNNGQILVRPSSPTNQIALNAQAKMLIKGYIAGDYPSREQSEEDSKTQNMEQRPYYRIARERRRREAIKLSTSDAIPIIRYSNFAGRETLLNLHLVTPTGEVNGGFYLLPFSSQITPLTATNIPPAMLKTPLEMWPIFTKGMTTLNSLGSLAKPLKANFVSWLSKIYRPFRDEDSVESSFETWRTFSLQLENGWLTVYDPLCPLQLTAASWKHFFKLRSLFGNGASQATLDYLNRLTQAELIALENLGADAQCLQNRDQLLTSGIRLYKVALTYLLTLPRGTDVDRELTFNQMPPSVKGDFLGFFQSSYVWNYYPFLMHPTNLPRQNQVKLHITFSSKPDASQKNEISLVLPDSWKVREDQDSVWFTMEEFVAPPE